MVSLHNRVPAPQLEHNACTGGRYDDQLGATQLNAVHITGIVDTGTQREHGVQQRCLAHSLVPHQHDLVPVRRLRTFLQLNDERECISESALAVLARQ